MGADADADANAEVRTLNPNDDAETLKVDDADDLEIASSAESDVEQYLYESNVEQARGKVGAGGQGTVVGSSYRAPVHLSLRTIDSLACRAPVRDGVLTWHQDTAATA